MLRKVVAGVTLFVALLTAAGFAGTYYRSFELSSHFRVQYAVLLLACALMLSFQRAWRILAIAVLALMANLELIAPFAPFEAIADVRSDLRVASCNVKFSNTHYKEFLSFVESCNPDVLFIQEANTDWLKQLENLRAVYPYNRYEPNRNGFGIAVYSKLPFRKVEIDNIEVPYILTRVRVQAKPLWLLNTHLFTPTNSWHFQNRNQELDSLAKVIQKLQGPVVVAGDFNTTMWSAYYERFLSSVHMLDVRSHRGIFATYPAANPFLRIPIDLCFVTSSVKVVSVKTGRNTGSDHLPLIVDLSIPSSP